MLVTRSHFAVRNPVLNKQPISNPTLKCPVVESKDQELKRAKAVKVKVNADGVEDTLNKTTTATTCTTSVSKNVFFQRLWSVDDEIVILQGIIDYIATKGADPSAYMNAFFLFIKDSIHVNDTKTQLSDKVRKLKNKYKTNAIKAKLPSNPHNQQLYDLSQKI
ncbi:probable transcription factor At4g00390 [Camellia sinensis]|uniref:probable transcription factor At4g00390 n=1 Tax=Camellia sinensis TaxID=4442 RepID=UPI001036BF45|nr:probable transcription factor At4g00390 [Camellia sinensis]